MTWFGYFLVGLQIYFFNVQGNVIPFIQSEFGLNYRIVSLHSVALALGLIVTGLVGRRVTRKLGRRRSMWTGAGGIAIGAFLLCLSPGPWTSIPSCLLIGFSGGMIAAVVPAMFADIHGERRGQAYAEQSIVAYGFGIVAPIATGAFVAIGVGWRGSVILGGLLGIALIVIFRNTPVPPGEPPPTVARAPLPAAYWAYWSVMAFTCALEFSVLIWGPAFLERVIGFSPAGAATGVAAFPVGVLLGRILIRALVRTIDPRTMLAVAYGIGVVGFLLYWAVGNEWSAILGILLLGLAVAPQYPMTMALAMGASRGATDTAAIRMTLAFGTAMLVAPAALGALADFVGLSLAHLTLPTLLAAAVLSFVVAGILERRA